MLYTRLPQVSNPQSNENNREALLREISPAMLRGYREAGESYREDQSIT